MLGLINCYVHLVWLWTAAFSRLLLYRTIAGFAAAACSSSVTHATWPWRLAMAKGAISAYKKEG